MCQPNTQHSGNIYQASTCHARPCEANDRGGVLVQREALCQGCSRVTDWMRCGGGGGGDNELNGTLGGADAMQGEPSPDSAETMGSVLIGTLGEDRYALSDAFERVVTIGDDDEEEDVRGLKDASVVSEGIEIDGEIWGQDLGGGPYGTSHLSSSNTGNAGSGLPPGGPSYLSDGGDGHVRKRRTVEKKRVRFASKVEVLYFRKDWATRSVRLEHKGRR
ncbi:hypothetical protein Daus18300_007699 [Diaporthe australafricana]|uniref:Uncharacterized protein n=1 Tax=Diaporthe australafricana TaxID=127596 RepID=A0ABR3WLE3_9PEZI